MISQVSTQNSQKGKIILKYYLIYFYDKDIIMILNTGPSSIWQNVGKHAFYGPWNNLVKQNGDYIDYNDYGARIEQFQPDSLELAYEDLSVTHRYPDPLPLVYDRDFSNLNTPFNSVGLADFRSGVRTGNRIDFSSTDGLKEAYWKDIASQEADQDTKDVDYSTFSTAVE